MKLITESALKVSVLVFSNDGDIAALIKSLEDLQKKARNGEFNYPVAQALYNGPITEEEKARADIFVRGLVRGN